MVSEDLHTKATDLIKRIFTVGVGALFLTEESLRFLVSEFKLPKELLNAVLETANKTRGEFLKNFSKEMMSHVVDKIDPKALIQEMLSKYEIDLRVRVKFRPKTKSKISDE